MRTVRITLAVGVVLVAQGVAVGIDFSHDVVPILKKHCVTCHGGREKEGDFSINTRQTVLESGVVELGRSADSHLMDLVLSNDRDAQMPPEDRPRLKKAEVETLRQWIDEGLIWTDGFTFEIRTYEPPLLPREVTLPVGLPGRQHPIDRMVDTYLIANRIPIPEESEDHVFLRRAYLDLIGLLPTIEQRDAFLGDLDPEKRAKLIDQLLNQHVDYAEHWLSFFNDLLRNDYSGTGFITGGRRQISGWLYSALESNVAYDELVRELAAPSSDASRGFIDGIKWRGTVSAGQTLPIQFAQSVSQAFLGINLKCASCHDSFIDRWTLNEAYGLAAVYSTDPLPLHRCDKPTGETQDAAWLFPEIGQIDPDASREERLRQLAALITDNRNGRFARTIVNRLWHRLMGHGLVHPLDAMQTEPWNEDVLDYLANHLVANDYDLKSVMRLIATSKSYQGKIDPSDDQRNLSPFRYRGPMPRRMTAEQFIDAVWKLTRAAPEVVEAPILRGGVSQEVLESTEVTGKWIWGPVSENGVPGGQTLLIRKQIELTDDVAAGGAVVTCDNEFQMFLANRQIASGGDWTKPQLVSLGPQLKKGKNSLVFRVRNLGSADGNNHAGFFFQAKWLLNNGETLSVRSDDSWQYNTTVPPSREGRMRSPGAGWKPVVELQPLDVWSSTLRANGLGLIARCDMFQESMPMVRASLMKNNPLMQALGRPMREQIVSMRPEGLTTLAAVELVNNETLTESIRNGASYWAKLPVDETSELVERLFAEALTRAPTDAERAVLVEMLGNDPSEEAIADALWAIMMLPEFFYVR